MPSLVSDDPIESDWLRVIDSALAEIAKDDNRAIEALHFFRRECDSEMNLISVRVGWLLTAQAFLVAGSIVALSGAATKTNNVGRLLPIVSIVTCILGIVLSHRSLSLLSVAEKTTVFWKERLCRLCRYGEGEQGLWIALYLARWRHGEKDRDHDESMKFSRYLPWTFVAFWIFLGLISLCATVSSQGWITL